MRKIAVTELEYRKAKDVFKSAMKDGFECLPAPLEEQALADFIKSNSIAHVIIGVDRYVGPLYDALPKGGVIARFGVGHDGVDKAKAKERGILCVNTPGALDNSVAEMAIGLIMSAARHIPKSCEMTKSGHWTPLVGAELAGRTLAVIGCGAIGRVVGRIASLGLGMNVVGFDLSFKDPEVLKGQYGFSSLHSSFEDAVRNADFVSLHIPGIPATRDFINAKTLAMLPKNSILVNTARGIVIDEDALYDSLSAGALAGAALDVFKVEPYVPASPTRDLRGLPNIIMTSHMGSSTTEACRRMALATLTNIGYAIAGEQEKMNIIKV